MAVKRTTKNPALAALLTIGASKDSIESARATIAAILSAPYADEATKQEALRALQSLCSVTNTSITSCNFQG